MNKLIEISNLKKVYNLSNRNELLLIENLNLTISKNSITSILGPSGCGKSTLLNILGLLDSNFHGNYFFEGNSIKEIKSKNLSNIRNKKIGFVHQFFHLIPELSVIENVTLPALVPIFTHFFPEDCSGKLELIGITPSSLEMTLYDPKFLVINLSNSFSASNLSIIFLPNLVSSISAEFEV